LKECRECRETKNIEEFYKDKNSKDGHRGVCKVCANTRVVQWFKDNPEKRKEHERRYARANRDWVNSKTAMRRAARKKAQVEDLGSKYLEHVFDFYGRKCLACPREDVTLDHVVPLSKGGSHGYRNFQVLCLSCNTSKNNRSETDYRDYTYKGILIARMFEENMVLQRPVIKREGGTNENMPMVQQGD